MITAAQENALMLASLIGGDEDSAAKRLDCAVLLTIADDTTSQSWATEISALLERTINVRHDPEDPVSVELVIGRAQPRTAAIVLYAAIDAEKAVVDLGPVRTSSNPPHPLFAAVAASATAAAVMVKAIEAEGLPPVTLPLQVRFNQLGIPAEKLHTAVDLNGAVLIGAGAVGHGFLRALRHVKAHGTLAIVDPKTVGGGNPNRCLYLTDDDIDRNKAEALAGNAQGDFPELRLMPFVEDFHSHVDKHGPSRTAIVTVDSRGVRRSIQAEVPGRVVDASTTDIQAVVVHSHRQPTEHACLACIYQHVRDENAREQAIADGLGIELSVVQERLISPAAAAKISQLHEGVDASIIEGMAYDSLYKQLCGEQVLKTPEGRQVLAPFAFVSNLAGALLVIELLRLEFGLATTNYWQVNPWGEPQARVRTLRPRLVGCEFCSKVYNRAVVEKYWGTGNFASESLPS